MQVILIEQFIISMPAEPYRILLAGFGDIRASGELPLLFKRVACELTAYCPRRIPVRMHRYWHTWHEADTNSPEKFVKGLEQLLETNTYNWIIPVDDSTLRALHDYLSPEYAKQILPVADQTHKALTSSKTALSLFSKKYEIETPPFTVYEEGKSIVECAAPVPFPLLLKTDRSGGGKGVFYCKNETELVTHFNARSEYEQHNLLIQAYIPGDNIAAEALYRNGVLLGFSCAKVFTTLRDEFSISVARLYAPHPDLVPIAERIGSVFGLNGFCNFTFMYDPHSGSYFLIEADLRPQSWFTLARFCGVDFSRAVQNYVAVPASMKSTELQASGPSILRNFSRDMLWSFRNYDFLNILAWACGINGRWKYIPWYNRGLFLHSLLQFLRTLLYDFVPLRTVVGKIKKFV